MSYDANTSFCRTLVDEWVRHGITTAVVAPGSRSTPLALALADRMETAVFHDERSAAFHALGRALATGIPVAVVCTSGTAAANFHPAVLEASASHIPMIVCTADRPAELHDTGANQTMDQTRLFGTAVRWFFDPGPPDGAASATWRSMASRAVAEATRPQPGPVHLNLPFREPLLPTGEALVEERGRPGDRPWTAFENGTPLVSDKTADRLALFVASHERGVIVAGQHTGVDWPTIHAFSEASGWPILADPVSDLRHSGSISTYDALARTDWAASHTPDAVIRIGRPPTSKALTRWIESAELVGIGGESAWLDESRTASEFVATNAARAIGAITKRLPTRTDLGWPIDWSSAEAAARAALDQFCDGLDEHFEGTVARDVAAALPPDGWLIVGSSMPIRDVDSFAAPRPNGRIRSNRGINGIDGMVSTASGVAAGSMAPTAALVGDIGFLHDSNGLIGITDRGLDLTLVVIDNDGGGIFSFLPQHGHDRFEQLFGTPHGVDIAALAGAHGISSIQPKPGNVRSAVTESMARGGVQLVMVKTDRARNVTLHGLAYDAVAETVG